jgi:tetratricopeptide (TPR) repeat protein
MNAGASRRFLVIESNSAIGDTVRLAQESFLRHWKRLREWLDADREFLLWRQQLRANMADWENTSRDRGALLSGAPLSVATKWREKRPEDLNEAEQSYIATSLEAKRRLQRRRVTGWVVVLLLTFGLLVWWQQWQARRIAAREQEKVAQAAALVIEANEHARRGETDMAFDKYRQALEVNPSLSEAYVQRAEAYVQHGNVYNQKKEFNAAIDAYNQAIALEPKNTITYVNRGLARENSGSIDLAIADYTKAIELKGDYAEAYFNRGAAYQQKGKDAEAIADFQRVIDLNTDPQMVQEARARLQKLGSPSVPPPPVPPPK